MQQTIIYTTMALQAIIIAMLYLRLRKIRPTYRQLLGLLEVLRIIYFEGDTSKNGKGIIPRKIWTEAGKAVNMSININTKAIFKGWV